ncbi:AAA family ATPase [Enterococcus faecium]|nr:AAA family ATPase [Enterococcus faecium]EME8183751.1 AAA family ATPase [Enterococcus faecium]HAQ4376855.1 AAA family ATPase [Enterococcus faecium]
MIDMDEYNQRIVEKCIENNIEVVGLADHGRVDTSESLRQSLQENNILVFPGFEISSAEKIHMVCLFSPDNEPDDLNRYLGKLGLSKIINGNETSNLSCLDIGKIVTEELNGFWYGAHVTSDNGILKIGQMQHVWSDSNLVAAQIPNSREKVDPKYLNILRNKDPQYKRDKPIALINAKDVSSPEDLDEKTASVLIKMSEPTFHGFINAFKDPQSRIRLNYDIKDSYQSCIKTIRVYGGYMEDLEIKFSDNLTTLIGGRGTGKSTLIGFIRYALEVNSTNEEINKENEELIKNNLGSNGRIELDIISNEQHGRFFTIVKRYGQRVIIKDEKGEVSNFSIKDIMPNVEIYGQNEIMSSIADSRTINKIISRLFTKENELNELEAEINKFYGLLRENTKKTDYYEERINDISNEIGDLPSLEDRLKYYDEAGISNKLGAVTKTAYTNTLFSAFEKNSSLLEIDIPKINFNPENKANKYALKLIVLGNRYNESIEKIKKEYKETFERLNSDFKTALEEWKIEKQSFEKEIKESLKEIPDIKDKNSTQIVSDYQELVEQVNMAKDKFREITRAESYKKQLLNERKGIIENIRELLDKRDYCLSKQLKKINRKKLDGKLTIDLLFRQNKHNLIEFLTSLHGVGLKSLQGINDDDNFDIFTFVQDIKEDVDLKDKYNINQAMENKLKLLTGEQLREIEGIILEDEPVIKLEVKGNLKLLNNLSKGQQCTAILNILLLDNKDPLIVDQPEDNLDNAFIADSLVDSIRKNKISRQYIFATHNANIPVFGDAELIVSLEEENGKGNIINNGIGSIDALGVKEQVVNILEGGEWAFKMREEKYGLK